MTGSESLTASPSCTKAAVGTQYHYRVWTTGKTWACHAKSPYEWFRSYGFQSKRDAEEWGAEALEEFIRNDRAYGRVE